MKSSKVKLRLAQAAGTVAIALGTGHAAAFAQADPAAPTTATEAVAATPAAQPDTDIIVTAQRRAEKLEDVPAAVVAISGPALLQAGIVRFQDLGNITSGVNIGRTGAITQATVRGITSQATSANGESNIGYYLDGFYIADPSFTNQDFANLQDIQILKGPQGTLYGRNATGGAILVQTLDPSDQFEASATASYATFDDKRVSAYVSVPLSDRIALGVTGNYRENKGYSKDINGFQPNFTPANPFIRTAGSNDRSAPYTDYAVRAKLKVDFTDNLKMILGYAYQYHQDARALTYVFNAGNILPAVQSLATAAAAAGIRTSTTRDRTSLNYRPFAATKGDLYTMLLEWDIPGGGNLQSRTSYLDKSDQSAFDFDGIASTTQLTSIGGKTVRKAFTQAFDYSYDGIEHLNLLAGLFYFEDEATTPINFNNGAANPRGTQSPGIYKTKYSISGYVDGTYDFDDRLFLTLGARYTIDRKSAEQANDAGTPGVFRSVRGIDPETGRLSVPAKTWKAFTPRAVLRYNVSTGTNVYASYSQGFKAGTYSPSAPLAPIRPEKITSYEAGLKTNQGGVRAEISAFLYNYRDLQLVTTNIVAGASNNSVTVNAVSSRIYGIDASISAPIQDVLNVRASVEWLHARYRNFPAARGVSISSVDGRNVTDASANYIPQNWAGLQMVRAPDWSGSVGADLNLDAFDGKLVLSGTGSFSSSFAPTNNSIFQFQATTPTGAVVPGIVSTSRKRRFLENGYFLANVQANWTDPSNRWTLGVFSDNVLNTRYKIVSTGNAFGSYDIFSEPRMTGARVSFRY